MHTLRALLPAAALVFALAAGASREARAEACEGAELCAAERFQRGKKLNAEGDRAGALEAYRAAWQLRRSYDIAANLGSLELDLGLHRDAAEHLEFAIRHYAPSAVTPEQLDKLRTRFAEASTHVAALVVSVDVEGAEVLVDGRSAGRAPLEAAVFVAPGQVKASATLAGYAAGEQTVAAHRGEETRVRLALVALPGADGGATVAAPPSDARPRSSEPRSVWPAVGLGALGVLGVAAGAGFLVSASAARAEGDTLREQLGIGTSGCASPTEQVASGCARLQQLAADSDASSRIGAGGLALGGVALTAAVTYLLWPAPRQPASTTARLLPIPAPGGAGVVYLGSF